MSKKTQAATSRRDAETAHSAAEAALEAGADHEDEELIHVPKGNSPFRFILTFLVVVFLLLIFTVTGPMMQSLSGGGQTDGEFMIWQGPNGEANTLTQREFLTQKQSHSRLMSILTGSSSNIEDEDTAAFLVADQYAIDAGVRVTDADLAAYLRDQLQITDTNVYRNAVANFGLTVSEFEELLRKQMRIERHRFLLASGLGVAPAEEVEQMWKDRYREYRFEYAMLTPTDLTEEAATETPNDEELRTWFDELSDVEKSTFNTAPMREAEFMIWYQDTPMPETFMAKNKRPEEEDPVQLAREYYDIVSAYRFLRPEPAEGEERNESLTFSFEEVQEIALSESKLYFALDRMRANFANRVRADVSTPFDLQAEAQGLDFVHEDDQTPRTYEEWRDFDKFGSERLANQLQRTAEGQFTGQVVVSDKAFVVPRVIRVLPPELPPFEDIRDQVAEKWVERRASELAQEKLQGIYDSLRPEGSEDDLVIGGVDVEEAAFASALEGAGLELKTRDWRDRSSAPEGGWAEAPEVDMFLRSQFNVFTMTDGQVSVPASDRSGNSFLVRLAGSRDPELVTKKPGDIQSIERGLGPRTQNDFFTQAFGFDALAERAGLRLIAPEPDPDAQPDTQPDTDVTE
ncbi:MAG: hypothetical protein AAF368_03525 [Planctomycetota bacterium]